jgi:hypothetical protein
LGIRPQHIDRIWAPFAPVGKKRRKISEKLGTLSVWPLFEMVAPLSSGSKSAANWGSPSGDRRGVGCRPTARPRLRGRLIDPAGRPVAAWIYGIDPYPPVLFLDAKPER